jgi:hypothetical protein
MERDSRRNKEVNFFMTGIFKADHAFENTVALDFEFFDPSPRLRRGGYTNYTNYTNSHELFYSG